MRILITGGTGLIGRALCDSLTADGHAAVVLSRSPEGAAGFPEGVAVVGWDSRTLGPWAEQLGRCDGVVHLAGESIAGGRWTRARKRRIRDSRVRTSGLLADAFAAAAERPGVLVQGSGIDYYGEGGDGVLTEDCPAGDGFLPEVAVEWEGASAPVEELGVRRAVIRTAPVLSDQGGLLPLMALPVRLFAGGRVGSGEQWMPWIHLADQVGAIRFLLEHPTASGPFNLCSPEPARNRAFVAALGAALGRPVWLPAPAFAVRLLLGEMGELALGSKRALPARLLELGFCFRFPRLDQALADLLGG
ncbi:MAG TPA: TIGR01777 family oxidoreductase [Thermoanaerobaculia bacterium]|nr:TIGR01777 family oxidoreductase [Thermoanaerobaculia bacterium]